MQTANVAIEAMNAMTFKMKSVHLYLLIVLPSSSGEVSS